jgi:3-hydroxy-D-aspartate aldolase
MPVDDIDTPALVLDLDAFHANLDLMANFAAQMGVKVRPHAKTHKSPVIAKLQIPGESASSRSPSRDARLTVKLSRLAGLSRIAEVAVCVDAAQGVRLLEATAEVPHGLCKH